MANKDFRKSYIDEAGEPHTIGIDIATGSVCRDEWTLDDLDKDTRARLIVFVFENIGKAPNLNTRWTSTDIRELLCRNQALGIDVNLSNNQINAVSDMIQIR